MFRHIYAFTDLNQNIFATWNNGRFKNRWKQVETFVNFAVRFEKIQNLLEYPVRKHSLVYNKMSSNQYSIYLDIFGEIFKNVLYIENLQKNVSFDKHVCTLIYNIG